MTTLQPILTNELLLTGTPLSQPSSAEPKIYNFEARAPIPTKIPNTISIDDLVAEFEQDPNMATAITKARHKLADEVYGKKAGALTYMRLKAGLSQVQLALIVETSQPHIARIEAGKNDPSTEMIGKIASALKFDAAEVFTAIHNQIKSRT